MKETLGLRGIQEFQMARGILRDIQCALQEAGEQHEECFVLLAGRRQKADSALIRSFYVPEQLPETHERGLSVTVPGDALQRLNVEWAKQNEELFAQVHSHPSMPYHSATDDRYPMVAVEGGLSIVVPLFGFCAMTDLRSCAVYRLWDKEWRWIPGREVDRLIRLI